MEGKEDKDYRLYLERSFRAIDDHFEGFSKLMSARLLNLDDRLLNIEKNSNEIKAQTLLTNSRVNHLEDDVVALNNRFLEHPINCPQAQSILEVKTSVQAIKDDLLEYTFFKRYPKTSVLIMGFALVMFGFGIYEAISGAKDRVKAKQNSEVVNTIDSNTR